MKSTRILVSVATLLTGAFLALVFHEAGLQQPVEALASMAANSAHRPNSSLRQPLLA